MFANWNNLLLSLLSSSFVIVMSYLASLNNYAIYCSSKYLVSCYCLMSIIYHKSINSAFRHKTTKLEWITKDQCYNETNVTMRLVEDKSKVTTNGTRTLLIFLYRRAGLFEVIFADLCAFSWFESFPYSWFLTINHHHWLVPNRNLRWYTD